MAAKVPSRKEQYRKLLKEAAYRPRNLFILATGFVTGIWAHPILIPFGILAYGILCYLDVNTEKFVNAVLTPTETKPRPASAAPKPAEPSPVRLTTPELLQLQVRITTVQKKIQRIYGQTDAFTHALFGDLTEIENLATKSAEFLGKAQTIQHYLLSENTMQIEQDLTALQEKSQNVADDFARRQYQQAYATRRKHLQALQDLQHMYERLVSHVTNVAISLESLHPRMMKLKTAHDTYSEAEIMQVSTQLRQILEDVEQLDSALKTELALPE
jgi:hypothetical protein